MASINDQGLPSYIAFDSSQRIKVLNDIDRDVAKLLHSAGLAVKALLNASTSHGIGAQPATLEQRKNTFTTATAQYFSLLSSIDVRLRRQIYALEEAELISTEAPAKASHSNSSVSAAFALFGGGQSSTPASPTAAEKSTSSATGGLGSLDVGWLNSRNDKVGKNMEAELWMKAQEFVSSLPIDENRGPGEVKGHDAAQNDPIEGAMQSD